MDSQANNNVSSSNNARQQCSVSSTNIEHKDCNSTTSSSSDRVYDFDDHTVLIPDCALKNKKHYCRCSKSHTISSDSNTKHLRPWITFVHVLCTAALAFFGIYLTSNVLIFGKKSYIKEMDDAIFRLSLNEHAIFTTPSPSTSSSTEPPPSSDKCEPLYVLVYIHCFVWFLFLILDHVARYMHHKTLRSRGHLRAYARLSRLAVIPFQLVSLWTVLLAIFIAIYAQQDKADMQPYCDANLLMSPKNGIAVLLVIEFVCVTVFSLLYANSVRKFTSEKPPPDVTGWDENNCDRWTPQILQDSENSNQQISEEFSNFEQQDKRCLLDLLDYYAHANRELSANLGYVSKRLHQLQVENQPPPTSQSSDNRKS